MNEKYGRRSASLPEIVVGGVLGGIIGYFVFFHDSNTETQKVIEVESDDLDSVSILNKICIGRIATDEFGNLDSNQDGEADMHLSDPNLCVDFQPIQE